MSTQKTDDETISEYYAMEENDITPEKLKQVLCKHPKRYTLPYFSLSLEWNIEGKICSKCLKIFELTITTKHRKV